MELDEYLRELRDADGSIASAGLSQLSGLPDEQLTALEEGWGEIPAVRRHEIVGRLVEMADDNAELDFYAVFCHALTDEESAVRERAVSGLWESDDRATIPKLVERLETDAEDPVREAVASVLGHFAALADAGKLVKRDAELVCQALMSALEDPDEPLTVRRRALESVASFRVPEVRGWIQWAYDHEEPLLRQSAVYAMGRSGDGVWSSILYDEMESDDPAMRYEAASAARELGDEEAIPCLAELVGDPDTQVSLAAVQAIGGIGGPRAHELLRSYVAESDDQVVREAAEDALAMLQADADDFSMFEVGRE